MLLLLLLLSLQLLLQPLLPFLLLTGSLFLFLRLSLLTSAALALMPLRKPF